MRYIRIDKADAGNGPGIRVVIWVSGCENACPGCHNPETWEYEQGKQFDQKAYDAIVAELKKPYYRGIALTGGDPLAPKNRFDMLAIAARLKADLPNRDIWCWTGHRYEELAGMDLSPIDVLVDGRFDIGTRIEDMRKPDWENILKYRGSSNQRVIDVAKSIEAGKAIEIE
jgi:anaerobic ribonucleoside-triphosphate reductase activating protein